MAVAVVVEVDVETGFVEVLRCAAVHDCGTVVNPTLVEANTHGGIAQGLGAALYEELLHDDAAQLLTTTLMDYTLPTAVEMPAELSVAHQETPTARRPSVPRAPASQAWLGRWRRWPAPSKMPWAWRGWR